MNRPTGGCSKILAVESTRSVSQAEAVDFLLDFATTGVTISDDVHWEDVYNIAESMITETNSLNQQQQKQQEQRLLDLKVQRVETMSRSYKAEEEKDKEEAEPNVKPNQEATRAKKKRSNEEEIKEETIAQLLKEDPESNEETKDDVLGDKKMTKAEKKEAKKRKKEQKQAKKEAKRAKKEAKKKKKESKKEK